MHMSSYNDDKEILLPDNSNRTTKVDYESEPFDIERSFIDEQERPLPLPSFIQNQKTIYEKSRSIAFLLSCCAKGYKKNLTHSIKNKELKIYYKLKSLATQLFDETNSQHKESLKFLYMLCLNKEITSDGDYRSIEWKKIGFQVKFEIYLLLSNILYDYRQIIQQQTFEDLAIFLYYS